MDLSVVPYNTHHQSSSNTKPDINDSDYGDVVEPKPFSSSSADDVIPSPLSSYSFLVKYGECMRNHAASIGGHASDGCGEFMPGGASRDSLTCAACGCHRNFHRRHIPSDHHPHYPALPPPPMLMYNVGPATPRWDHPQRRPHKLHHHRNGGRFLDHQQNQNQNQNNHNTDDDDRRSETPEREEVQAQLQNLQTTAGGVGSTGRVTATATTTPPNTASCKRSRTKFTQEQKDRMLAFAEKIGWRMQRHDDVALNQFCSEVGVKRNVLKVWMHNNKNAHRRRESGPPPPPQSQPAPPPQPIGV